MSAITILEEMIEDTRKRHDYAEDNNWKIHYQGGVELLEEALERIKKEETVESLLEEMNIPITLCNGGSHNGPMEWQVRTIPYALGEGHTPLLAIQALRENLNNYSNE